MGEDNIKTYPSEIECYDVDWIGLGDDKDQRRARVSTEMNLQASLMTRNLLTKSAIKRRNINPLNTELNPICQ